MQLRIGSFLAADDEEDRKATSRAFAANARSASIASFSRLNFA
jgi:hypothetical protein